MRMMKPLPTLVDPTWKEADWVREMHAHFARTGHYRARDITRVLGNQAEGVELRPDPSPIQQRNQKTRRD
jgi:hypothetical protein